MGLVVFGTALVVWAVTAGQTENAQGAFLALFSPSRRLSVEISLISAHAVRLKDGLHNAVDRLHEYVSVEPVRGFNKSLVRPFPSFPTSSSFSRLCSRRF
jgi:hypothetical protein